MSVKQPSSYYNPTNNTHRKRVVLNTKLTNQLKDATGFATEKI